MISHLIEYHSIDNIYLLEITYNHVRTKMKIGSIPEDSYFEKVVVDFEKAEIRFIDRIGNLLERVGISIHVD